MKMKITKNEAKSFLIEDLKKFYTHQSWDWEADFRFAQKAYNDIDIINDFEHLLNSGTIWPRLIQFHKIRFSFIKRKRISLLNELKKENKVESCWSGTGFGGKSYFGVNRVRTWMLKNKGNNNDRT